ncbi:MAG TPA: carboxylate-amine ligase [Gammaproteobacteria bacterium]|nr:carboxylate-amine ligase [Gammaproteobacteria bacterium]
MVANKEPDFTVGIEEEHLLVDRETRDLANDPPAAMLEECAYLCEGQVSPEFLRAQIEVGTRVCNTIDEARWDLARLRRVIVQVAGRHGLAPIAASTHPFAHWLMQKRTEKDRYRALAREMQASARRLLICGMHVHVGIDDDELRIDLMNQLAYFLPHLLAMSCSSPFWEGENTGLKSYRLTVFDALPRTGLPEPFASFAEYQRHVNVLIEAGVLEDATKIWWDLRPSARYPTLETRIMDVCTRLDDAVSLAALVVCLLRMLFRLRRSNQRWRIYARMLVNENRWRARRYSFDDGLIDLAKGQVVPFETLLDELIELVLDDAEHLGCAQEVLRTRDILGRGTSAHRQVAIYEQAKADGAAETEALQAVVDFLIEETARGL